MKGFSTHNLWRMKKFYSLYLGNNELEKLVIRVSPEKIRLLNLELILSEEYGVSYAHAFNLVGCFIYEILLDDSLTLEITGKIFTEIIESFPTAEDKKALAEKIINTCIRSFNQRKIILPLNIINRKINYLSILAKSFHSDIEIV
ncbi:hypothetical protein [Candidatus Uabimicrobium amorphum]|uniref:hypothetical protein n=1 Tax=Uabimicrobium amorphum TaxID=2596890 RepID=UPI001E50D895|nr:hypothetical protein [Candidatus Uabimicrobium amorphum]